MTSKQRSQKPVLGRFNLDILDNCQSMKGRITTNHWSMLRTKNEIFKCPLNACNPRIPNQKRNPSSPSNGEERWASAQSTCKNTAKKIEISKNHYKQKVDILKRKYWYEEPKPLKFYKYSMGAKTFFLGLSDAPRS